MNATQSRTPDTLLDEALRLLAEYDAGLSTGATRELAELRERVATLEEETGTLRWQLDMLTENH